ncbi:MAG: hypothetical protein ACFCGT_18620 [Sandaracinaceae bacterium]
MASDDPLDRLVDELGQGDPFPLALLGLASAGASLDRFVDACLAEAGEAPTAEPDLRSGMLDALLGLIALRQTYDRAMAPALEDEAVVADRPDLDGPWPRSLLR